MLEDYLGPAWQYLDTVNCHMGKDHLSYAIVEGLPLLHHTNSIYLNNHKSKSAKTNTGCQLACYIYSDMITREVDIQLMMKQGG